jgi:hypothetical protein
MPLPTATLEKGYYLFPNIISSLETIDGHDSISKFRRRGYLSGTVQLAPHLDHLFEIACDPWLIGLTYHYNFSGKKLVKHL